ncbi:MAG: shikimate kinase [Bacteroidota bacterium]
MQSIFLIGFMGTGKSIAGKKIAFHLGYQYIDLDTAIENKYNQKITAIFKSLGEEEFRKMEAAMLREVAKENTIISCGGGTPCFFDNMEFINKNGISIYLKTNRTILISRLIHNKSKRPLLSDKSDNELIVFINNLLDKREPFYNQATHIFQMDKKRLQDLVELINSHNKII